LRVDFYHLQASPLERALPPLLERVLGAGHRAVVLAASEARIEALASLLWTFRSDSWLPHGTRKDGTPGEHPVWLTEQDENPNGADVVVLTEGMVTGRTEFVRCLDIFDGANEEALGAARGRWKEAKSQGHELHYWQQTDTGWQEREL
jgi:DNA polymerase III subunit chi